MQRSDLIVHHAAERGSVAEDLNGRPRMADTCLILCGISGIPGYTEKLPFSRRLIKPKTSSGRDR